MRSSRGTAQFLLVAFFVLAFLVYACTRNDHAAPPAKAAKQAPAAAQADDDDDD